MKALILFNEGQEEIKFFKEFSGFDFEGVKVHYNPKTLEFTISGDFYIEFDNFRGRDKFWIMNDEFVYCSIESRLIRRLIIKEIK